MKRHMLAQRRFCWACKQSLLEDLSDSREDTPVKLLWMCSNRDVERVPLCSRIDMLFYDIVQ